MCMSVQSHRWRNSWRFKHQTLNHARYVLSVQSLLALNPKLLTDSTGLEHDAHDTAYPLVTGLRALRILKGTPLGAFSSILPPFNPHLQSSPSGTGLFVTYGKPTSRRFGGLDIMVT